MIKKLTISLFLVLMFPLSSMSIEICENKELGKLAVLQNGRVKPLYTHANELIKFVTGKSKINNLGAVEAYCRLSLTGLFPHLNFSVSPLIEHVKIKEILDYDNNKNITTQEIEDDYRSDLLLAMRKEVAGSSLQKSIQKLLNRIG